MMNYKAKVNAIEFAKWVLEKGFRMVGYKWQLREERLFDDELYILYEKEVKSTLAPVSGCKHENETMRQGDGFTYSVCSDCGADL